jgi:hypothetical protein
VTPAGRSPSFPLKPVQVGWWPVTATHHWRSGPRRPAKMAPSPAAANSRSQKGRMRCKTRGLLVKFPHAFGSQRTGGFASIDDNTRESKGNGSWPAPRRAVNRVLSRNRCVAWLLILGLEGPLESRSERQHPCEIHSVNHRPSCPHPLTGTWIFGR